MGELGAGSGSDFPTSIDTDLEVEVNSAESGSTIVRAEVPNDLADAIINIENTIGASLSTTRYGFLPGGAWVDVRSKGATGDGVTDDSSAIQAAIDTEYNVFFPSGTYMAHGLTQSTDFQGFYSNGLKAIIQKNANGDLFSCSGNYVLMQNLRFKGDAASPVYTGDNIVCTGRDLILLNCSSMWAYGRAVKATGEHIQIIGTAAGVYQTANGTSSGYDIEIGTVGTVTYYHTLVGIYTSQQTGGILLNDTGSHFLMGSQIGKLKIYTTDSESQPSGTNGGMTIGNRILGNVTVGISNAVFVGNHFGTLTITFVLGTGGCKFDATNVLTTGGTTITNNGNSGSNFIMTNRGDGGTYNVHNIQLGDDTDAYSSTINIIYGTGSPEGQVSANIGSQYYNFSGGSGTTLYIKESGVHTNTGWVGK